MAAWGGSSWEEAVDEGDVVFFLVGMLTSPPAIMEQIQLSPSIA